MTILAYPIASIIALAVFGIIVTRSVIGLERENYADRLRECADFGLAHPDLDRPHGLKGALESRNASGVKAVRTHNGDVG